MVPFKVAFLFLFFPVILNAQSLFWIQPDQQEFLWHEEMKLRYPENFSPFENYPVDWSTWLDQNETPSEPMIRSWNSILNDQISAKNANELSLSGFFYGEGRISTKPISNYYFRGSGVPGGGIQSGSTFAVVTALQVDNDLVADSDYRGRVSNAVNKSKVNGYLVHKYAYLRGKWQNFEMMGGKQKVFWGPTQSYSLILGHSSPPADLLWFRYRFKALQFTHFWGQLDHSVFDSSGYYPQETELMRNLLGTRAEVRVTDHLVLGASQTVIFVTTGYGFKFSYLNPFISYFGERQNTGTSFADDNISYGVDMSYRIPGIHGYGSMLLDDFSLDGLVVNKLGFQGGILVSNPVWDLPMTVGFEWTRIMPKTYTVKDNSGPAWLNYVFYSRMIDHNKKDLTSGAILGHPNGPDSWEVMAKTRWWMWYPLWLELKGKYSVSGLGNNLVPLPDGSLRFSQKQFRSDWRLLARYEYNGWLYADTFVQWVGVKNPGHTNGFLNDFIGGITIGMDLGKVIPMPETLVSAF